MTATVLELCTGGGGQALGLEGAGFKCVGAVEIDEQACTTLRLNRPSWNTLQLDLRDVRGSLFRGVDLIAAGIPCPPFSIAGKQLGSKDERDLFPEALRLIEEAEPSAVLFENVPGLASARFSGYLQGVILRLTRLGYKVHRQIVNASDFGVPQLRPRFVLVGLRPSAFQRFHGIKTVRARSTVAVAIGDLMGARGWRGIGAWTERARTIAPTLVGGSKKHGGPDLGPTRAKEQWRFLGIDGMGIGDDAPTWEFPENGLPRLTLRMAARLQGFPDSWRFAGGKTAAYRQIGNAFPPPVANAVGLAIRSALDVRTKPLRAEPPTLSAQVG